MTINVIPIPAVGYTDVFTYSWWLHPSISLIFLLIQCFRHRTNIWRWCFQSLGISSSGVRKVPSPMEVLPCHANNHCCENGMNFVWSRQRTTRACLKLGYTIPPLHKTSEETYDIPGSSCFQTPKWSWLFKFHPEQVDQGRSSIVGREFEEKHEPAKQVWGVFLLTSNSLP